jgi:hypothetical protein
VTQVGRRRRAGRAGLLRIGPGRDHPPRRGRWWRGEWPLLLTLVPAAAVHLIALIGYRPILWLLGDSISYLSEGTTPRPDEWRPIGYSILLWLMKPLHSLLAVSVLQQILGVAMGVAVYLAARRLGAPRWLATLATIPVLFDGYLLALDQSLLSETLFTVLLLGSLLLAILWRRRPPLWACLLCGLGIGAADVTRTAGLPVAILVAVFLLIRRAGVVRVVGLLVTFAIPVLLYSAWYDRDYGEFTVSPTGFQLYGHVMQYVDCATLPHIDHERTLCVKPPPHTKDPEDWYVFSTASPLLKLPGDLAARDREARSFDLMAIKHQPLGYLHYVASVLGSYFGTGVHAIFWYHFEPHYYALPPTAVAAGTAYTGHPVRQTQPSPTLAPFLHDYQNIVYLPGPGYLFLLLVGLAGWIFGRDPTRRGLRGIVGLLSLCSLAVIALPAFAVPVEERYRVPTLPLLSLAAALGGLLVAYRIRARGRTLVLPGAEPVAAERTATTTPGSGAPGLPPVDADSGAAPPQPRSTAAAPSVDGLDEDA